MSILDREIASKRSRLAWASLWTLAFYSSLALATRFFHPPPPLEPPPKPIVSDWVDIEPPPPPPTPTSATHHAGRASPGAVSRPAPAKVVEAAQAGAVVESPVVDFGDTIVVGSSEARYVGGATSDTGTAKKPVAEASPTASPGDGGSQGSAPRLAGGTVWDCPFPEEADEGAIDRAVVGLRVEVENDGRVLSAQVTKDPGHGFGREARRCALAKRWVPGRTSTGLAQRSTANVNVRFER